MTFKNSKFIQLLSLLLASLTSIASAADKPNIVLIMADDFGVGNINAYGTSKELIRTPNLNRLADDGMLFTNANAPGSICSPTRYGMLTGRYAWRGPLKVGVVGVYDPLIIETDRVNMANYFQNLGYATAQVGKWHLGYGETKPPKWTEGVRGPNDVGFDYHFGLPQNLDDELRVWIENDQIYGLRSKKRSFYAKNFYGGPYVGFDAPQRSRETAGEYITDKAIEWIKRIARSETDQPFFLYFAPASVHHPIVPSEKMRGSSNAGAYGDFIQDLDYDVGRIISTLEYEGIDEETIIIFTADNGSDVPNNNRSPETQAVNLGLATNGVSRGDKHTIYEGGARVPLIVRWDGKIAKSTRSDRNVNLVDLYSTLAEAITGTVAPVEDAPDSISFAPTLLGETQGPRPAMISSNAAGLQAIRLGTWKYIDGKFPDEASEHLRKVFKAEATPALYDLATDPSESKNLLEQHPEVAERMQATLDEYRAQPTRR